MKFCFWFLLFWGCTALLSQNTTGLIHLNSPAYQPGYNLIYPFGQNDVFLLNECGEYVHKWDGQPGRIPGAAAYLSEKGWLIRCSSKGFSASDTIWAGGAGETIDWLNWEGEVLHTFQLNNQKFRLHHDVKELPNGNLLAIIWENFSPQQAMEAGRRPDLIIEGAVWPDAIIEINPLTSKIVWEWHAWDHLIQDYNPNLQNYGDVAAHPEKINLNHVSASGQADWMHSNAIDYHPQLDLIALSVAHFNEIWFIDHSTTTAEASSGSGGRFGRGGDLVYRWGNPRAYKNGTQQDQLLFFQHDAHWLPDGSLAVFNNRANPQFSNGLIFQPVLDSVAWTFKKSVSGTYLPEKPERTFFHPVDKTRMQSSGLSSIQLLYNGNVLLFSGNQGYAFEFNPMNNEMIWEYIIPYRNGFPISQGSVASNNLSFKVKRYAPDFPAFSGLDLQPKGYLELNPNEQACETLFAHSPTQNLSVEVYPNPVNDLVYISSQFTAAWSCIVTNTLGVGISNLQIQPGINVIKTTDWKPGVYYLHNLEKTWTFKLVKL